MESGKCIYPKCELEARCRAENSRYDGAHSDYYKECPDGSGYGHKFICDTHHDLLEFLRLSGALEFEVKPRR